MDKRIKFLLSFLVAAILLTDAIGCLRFLSPRKIRLNSPVNGSVYASSFLAMGDAWTPEGLPRVELRAFHPESGAIELFPAERLKVRYRGVAVRELAIFQARIELPREGTWEIVARMPDPTGVLQDGLSSETRTITVRTGASDHLFRAFGADHLVWFAALISLFVIIILRYRRPRSQKEKFIVSLLIGAGALVNELSYHIYWVAIDGFSVSNSLMLHMCGVSLFLVPFLLFMKESKGRQRLFEISWFWGLGAAFQAYLAPDIWTHSLPELRYFAFFISHGMLILGPLFFALTTGSRLSLRSCLRAAAITFVVTASMWGINQLFRFIPPYEPANYFMIAYPPPTGSVIDIFADIFGPSPLYGIGLSLMGLALFGILYAPFPLIKLLKARVGKASEGRAGEGK